MRNRVKLLCLTPATGKVRRYVDRVRSGMFHTAGICDAAKDNIERLRLEGWPLTGNTDEVPK